jgi:hypothetical protein
MSFPGLVNLRARAHANLLLSQPSQRRDMIARHFGNGQIVHQSRAHQSRL